MHVDVFKNKETKITDELGSKFRIIHGRKKAHGRRRKSQLKTLRKHFHQLRPSEALCNLEASLGFNVMETGGAHLG